MEIGRNPESASKLLRDVCEMRLTGSVAKDAVGNYVCDLAQRRCHEVVDRGEQVTECTADPAQVFHAAVEVRHKMPRAPPEIDMAVRFPSGEFTLPVTESTFNAWKQKVKARRYCIERPEFDRCFHEKV